MLRFTTRDLLWLMVVMGMGAGWWVHYQRLTRPPKLYRDREIVARHRLYIVEYGESPFPGQGPEIVPQGTTMSLSQVFKKLAIDPSRLSDFREVQYNRGVTLSWQISPRYALICLTTDYDVTLAFDDPNRTIYGAYIQDRENTNSPPGPRIEKEQPTEPATVGGVEL